MVTAIPPLKDSELIEFGNANRARPDGNPSKIVVASYNIRYAVGRFLIGSGLLRKAGVTSHRLRPVHVGENIHRAAEAFRSNTLMPAPAILALQEADKHTRRAGGHHVARELADTLDMNWIHVPAGIPRGQAPADRQWWLNFEEQIGLQDAGDTGVALLSKYQLADITRIDLPWHECPWRPRVAMAATVNLGGKELRILNAHVDPHAAVGGQLEQVEVLLTEAEKHQGPLLIAGDFNTLSKKKCVETQAFMQQRGFQSAIPIGTATWRGAGIRLHADWIFYRDVSVSRWGVARPLNVSDHWPIWVEVEPNQQMNGVAKL
ncbi:MAG TPA: endonuclease/exonuclease/phosphatase family protein [Pyrinomonadaceae bacterium]|nr:endonuclease/exonuclease/phosphatase family protein [Pyrinomonadaceae bacterium]